MISHMIGRTATLGLVAALALGACGGGGDDEAAPGTTEPEFPIVSGTFALNGENMNDIDGNWTSCSGTGGYDDFRAGMDVTVRDGSGKIIGTGSARNMDPGDEPEANPITPLEFAAVAAKRADGCTLKFEVPLVEAADFYAVEAGSRGDLTYSHAELEATDWWIQLTLG